MNHSNPHMTAALIYCQQAKDLLDAFAASIREVTTLHEDQFQAVVRAMTTADGLTI